MQNETPGKVAVNLETGFTENFNELIPLQGELKEYEDLEGRDRLKSSIVSEGIIFPTFVWKEPGEEGRKFIWDGHGRGDVYQEMQSEGWEIPPIPVVYILAKNKTDAKVKLLKKEQDYRRKVTREGLSDFIADSDIDVPDLEGLNLPGLGELNLDFLNDLTGEEEEKNERSGENTSAGAAPENPSTQLGDLFQLGEHRLICGDSTDPETVALLMDGEKATILHADPPYGMGKESDGVLNDNLYKEKLDLFQMEWIRAFRPHTEDNGSIYIWGNPTDLWRLWFLHLEETEILSLRNQIVWDKKNIPGMKSDLLTQYPQATEHCLFIQIGKQFIGNINSEDFPEAWDTVRVYLEEQALAVELKNSHIQEICGVASMYSHWFTKSQFTLIPRKHYESLARAYPGNFEKPWKELKRQWDRVKGDARTVINGQPEGTRSYFDNGHEVMRDVWEFPRVINEDRLGHATPKPVAMMERAIISSSPKGAIVAEPFGGTGTTMVSCENTGRRCRMAELSPAWCDVIIDRWERHTGKKAVKIN